MPSGSRRQFLSRTAVVPLALCAAPALAAPRFGPRNAFGPWFGLPTIMLDTLSKSSFRAHVGSDFRLIAPDGRRVRAVLSEVNDAPGQQAAADASFSLVFTAPADAPQVQQIYTVEQEGIGQFALFLVPTHAADTGVEYEAVFNRMER